MHPFPETRLRPRIDADQGRDRSVPRDTISIVIKRQLRVVRLRFFEHSNRFRRFFLSSITLNPSPLLLRVPSYENIDRNRSIGPIQAKIYSKYIYIYIKICKIFIENNYDFVEIFTSSNYFNLTIAFLKRIFITFRMNAVLFKLAAII